MEELDLKDFLTYLKKYLWALIAVPVIAILRVLYYDTSVKTPRTALLTAKDAIEKVDAKIAGVVINDIDRKVGHYYNYYDGYYEDRHVK